MNFPSYDDIRELNEELNYNSFLHWYHDDLFALTWWFLLFSTVVPIIIWWKVVDRKRLKEISVLGLFSAMTASFFDLIGVTLGLWNYPDKLIPVIPPLLPADLVVIPVSSMIIYQYTTTFFSYLWKYLILSIILAYVIEPSFELFDMYTKHKWWNHTFSLVGLFMYGMLIRHFTIIVLSKTK